MSQLISIKSIGKVEDMKRGAFISANLLLIDTDYFVSIWHFIDAANNIEIFRYKVPSRIEFVDLAIVDDYLCWTDLLSEIRKIDIIKAINGEYSDDKGFIYSKSDYATLCRTNPIFEPNIRIESNIDNMQNKFLFHQFAYRYIFTDGQFSYLSPFSDVLYLTNEFTLLIIQAAFVSDLKSIQWYYRTSQTGSWRLFKDDLDTNDFVLSQSTLKTISVLPTEYSFNTNSDIPLKCNSIESFRNRFIFGGVQYRERKVQELLSGKTELRVVSNQISSTISHRDIEKPSYAIEYIDKLGQTICVSDLKLNFPNIPFDYTKYLYAIGAITYDADIKYLRILKRELEQVLFSRYSSYVFYKDNETSKYIYILKSEYDRLNSMAIAAGINLRLLTKTNETLKLLDGSSSAITDALVQSTAYPFQQTETIGGTDYYRFEYNGDIDILNTTALFPKDTLKDLTLTGFTEIIYNSPLLTTNKYIYLNQKSKMQYDLTLSLIREFKDINDTYNIISSVFDGIYIYEIAEDRILRKYTEEYLLLTETTAFSSQTINTFSLSYDKDFIYVIDNIGHLRKYDKNLNFIGDTGIIIAYNKTYQFTLTVAGTEKYLTSNCPIIVYEDNIICVSKTNIKVYNKTDYTLKNTCVIGQWQAIEMHTNSICYLGGKFIFNSITLTDKKFDDNLWKVDINKLIFEVDIQTIITTQSLNLDSLKSLYYLKVDDQTYSLENSIYYQPYLHVSNNIFFNFNFDKTDQDLITEFYSVLYSSNTSQLVELQSSNDTVSQNYYRVSTTIDVADFSAIGDTIELSNEKDMFIDSAKELVRSAWDFGKTDTQIFQSGSPKFITQLNSDKTEYQHVLNSGQLIADTNINLLNIVDVSKRKELSENWGAIKAVVAKGNLLKVFQERNVSSIYLDRLEVQQGDEAQQQTDSETLGTVNDGVTNFGTKYASSIVKDGNTIYFYDKLNKCIAEDSSNGTRDISTSAQISLLIDSINTKITSAENAGKLVKVTTGVKKNDKIVYFTFHIPISFQDEDTDEIIWDIETTTLIYNEETNLFEGIASFAYENYVNIGEDIYMLDGINGVSKQSASALKNKFNNVQYPQEVSTHFTYPEDVLFMSLMIDENTLKNDGTGWTGYEVMTYDDGSVLTKDSSRALYSRLLNKKFKVVENKLSADFLKGIKKITFETSLPQDKAVALQNGDDLRGKTISIYLSNNLNIETVIEQIGLTLIKN